ncbi:MAG: hypothetical protein ACI4NE_03060, partial [Succinivibrio sp.]
ERTLGKGEVPSSILGISTSRHYNIKSLNYQNFSSDFYNSNFSNNFFKNFNFGLNKPLLHSLSADRTKIDKNNTKKIDILCEKESVIQPISSVGELSILSIIGILFKEQLSLELSPTLKVFLSILTNLCKNSPSYIIDYSNAELLDRVHGLFSQVQIRRHIERLVKLGLISVTYGQNSSRSIMLSCVNDFAGKFVSVSSLYRESGASKLKASEILVFSYLLDKSSFFAKADLGFFTDHEDAALICKELSISDRTLRNAYASLIELKAISYCSEDSKKAVKAVNISDDISIQYSEKFNITSSDHCRKIVLKRCKSCSADTDLSSMTNDSLKSLLLSLKTKKTVGKKCRFPQGTSGKKGSQKTESLEKNDLSINKELNEYINNDNINAQQIAVGNTYLDVKNDPIGIRIIPPSLTGSSDWYIQAKSGSHAHLDLKIDPLTFIRLKKINGINLSSSTLSHTYVSSLLSKKRVLLQIEDLCGPLQNVVRNFDISRSV